MILLIYVMITPITTQTLPNIHTNSTQKRTYIQIYLATTQNTLHCASDHYLNLMKFTHDELPTLHVVMRTVSKQGTIVYNNFMHHQPAHSWVGVVS